MREMKNQKRNTTSEENSPAIKTDNNYHRKSE